MEDKLVLSELKDQGFFESVFSIKFKKNITYERYVFSELNCISRNAALIELSLINLKYYYCYKKKKNNQLQRI